MENLQLSNLCKLENNCNNKDTDEIKDNGTKNINQNNKIQNENQDSYVTTSYETHNINFTKYIDKINLLLSCYSKSGEKI